MDRVVTLRTTFNAGLYGAIFNRPARKQLSKTGSTSLSGGEYKPRRTKARYRAYNGLKREQAIQLQREHDKASKTTREA